MRAPLAVLGALLLAAPALAGCLQGERPGNGEDSPGPAAGEAAPAWSFVDTEGVTRSNATSQGNATLLFFMATWCTTCRAKAPILADVAEDYRERGLQVYSVSVDTAHDTTARLEAWKRELAQPWPHGKDPTGTILHTFSITMQSSFVVLDPAGDVVRQWSYPGPDEADLRAAVDDALARGSP